MRNRTSLCLAAALIGGAWVAPAQTRGRNFNLSIKTENAEHCADLRASSSNGEVSQASDTVTLGARDASALEIDDNAGHAMVKVRAWDRAEYAVETCRIAAAETKAAADQLISGISVSHSAGRFTTNGPANNDGNWQVYFLVRAPRNANLDLSTKNGPISVEGIVGTIKAQAINGPLALTDCGGRVEAHTTNGPISFSGGSGDVKLEARNGPISLELKGDTWNGAQLDARTQNGPVSVHIPDNFKSGVRLQSSGHAPLSCNIEACRNAFTDATSSERVLRFNGSADTVKVTTSNGPLSVNGARRRVI